jgi:tRNA pseudouridine38-40 synthase
MREATARLVGRHDFAAFAAGAGGVRTVRRAAWDEQNDVLRFQIEADAFLRGMVRGIVGTLLWVGRGKASAAQFEAILRSCDRAQAGPSAPARGLCLLDVSYAAAGQAEPARARQESESEDDE